MEKDGSDSLCDVETQVHFPDGEAKQVEHPEINNYAEDLFKDSRAERTVPLEAVEEDPEEPQDLHSEEKEYYWFPEDSDDDFFGRGPFFIGFFVKEDGLGEVDFVEVAEVLVVEVVTIPPHVEREVRVYSDDVPHQLVELDRLKEREVRHIVELDEDAYNVEGVHCPS